ncbi:MAG: hypothetical protein OXR73_08015 [Myxococcales bacterium]|nr:hypothetical protein [Myxococcales bacterium]
MSIANAAAPHLVDVLMIVLMIVVVVVVVCGRRCGPGGLLDTATASRTTLTGPGPSLPFRDAPRWHG